MEQPTPSIVDIVDPTETEVALLAPVIGLHVLNALTSNQQLITDRFLMPGKYGTIELNHFVYQFDDGFVFQGGLLGSGSWSEVYISRHYERKADHTWRSTLCVIKKQKADGALQEALSAFVDTRGKMLKEAYFLCGKVLDTDNLPLITRFNYYGKNLTSFFNCEGNAVKTITASQWSTAIINLALRLKNTHEFNIIHGDINPDNICILYTKDNNGKIIIKSLNLVDWASAHAVGDPDIPGKVAYQPYESLFCPFLKNQKTDVFSLGRTLSYILNNNSKEAFSVDTYAEFQKLAAHMDSFKQDNRPTLAMVIVALIEIKLKCDPAPVQTPVSADNPVPATSPQRANP
jgi:serine/threonine protein kinase